MPGAVAAPSGAPAREDSAPPPAVIVKPVAVHRLAPSHAPIPHAPPAPDAPGDSTNTYEAPRAGYDRMPPGIRYVGDLRTKLYYRVGCAGPAHIPPEAQYLYMTEEGALSDGFSRSPEAC
jgi:hypothetical protein